QPGLKSGMLSPGLNSSTLGLPAAAAYCWLSRSLSFLSQPTLENSTLPSGEIQNTVGTLVSPYALDAGYLPISSSATGKFTPNFCANAALSAALSCETPIICALSLP